MFKEINISRNGETINHPKINPRITTIPPPSNEQIKEKIIYTI